MMSETTDKVPICTINGDTVYGTPNEQFACGLVAGETIEVLREKWRSATVLRVWFYDGVIVDVSLDGSTRSIYPGMGDLIRRPADDAGGSK